MSRERHSLVEAPPPLAADTGPVRPSPSSLLPQQAFDDDEPTGVLGTIKEMPVGEIVQTLQQGNKDALVEVKPKGEPVGVIGIERGRVVFAQTDGLSGEAAFNHLFAAHRGAFRIRYGRRPEVKNIDKDPTWLILEAARLMDERRAESPVFDTPPGGTPILPSGLGPASFTPSPFDALPRTDTPFGRFFDEAGVKTPPPIALPAEAQRFQSLHVADVLDDVDDIDRVDTDVTTRARRASVPVTPAQ